MRHHLLLLALAFALVVVGVATTASPAGVVARSAARWQLVDNQQRNCVSFGSPYSSRTTYFAIWIEGRWRRPIDVGIEALPAGAAWWTSYSPIAPGSSDGVGSLAYVAVKLDVSTPLGTYTPRLWATDGSSRSR
jgi:uncharacterized protein DUF5980